MHQLTLPIDHDGNALVEKLRSRLKLPHLQDEDVTVFQRAVDARKKDRLCFSYTVDICVDEATEARLLGKKHGRLQVQSRPDTAYHFLEKGPFQAGERRPLIVGMGPAGIFSGLLLGQMGLRPVIVERGKMAGPRARDVTRFWRSGAFDPDSNVQFGEGGAGTFSDGKLYTQIKDRENRVRKVLEELALHGAPEDILINARPHIGTDKLITVLRRLRETILSLGGEIRYEAKVADLMIEDQRVRGVLLDNGEILETDHVILAVGHSARDAFEMLAKHQIVMEPKPFSIGVRIEHPQAWINKTQHGSFAGHERLGSAAYRFVHHGRDRRRSVYSFCMCPGGLVVGAASEPGRLVTNGMSSYARDEANANSGFMVEVLPSDFPSDGPLGGIAFQRDLEERAFRLGGGNYHAPAQLLGDFMRDRASTKLGAVQPSFRPGVKLTDLRECLPAFVVKALKDAVPKIARRLPGFDHPDAILTAVESRSSSPLRITRNADCESVHMKGLFPTGEGAGYAGGIISAAVDGLRVAEAVGRRH